MGEVWVGWAGAAGASKAGAPATPDVAPGTTTAPAAAARRAVSHLIPQSSLSLCIVLRCRAPSESVHLTRLAHFPGGRGMGSSLLLPLECDGVSLPPPRLTAPTIIQK